MCLNLTAREQRNRLASLDDALLVDTGLIRADALAETARPLGGIPATWRRQDQQTSGFSC